MYFKHTYLLRSTVGKSVGARNPEHVISASVASDVAVGAIVVLVRVDASTEAVRRPQCKFHALVRASLRYCNNNSVGDT